MTGYILPTTNDPWQVMTLDAVIDGEPFHMQLELRYLPAPDRWFVSIRDHADGELLVNQVPLVCSYGQANDLLEPFRHLRQGKGLGTLLCLRTTDRPSTPDPAGGNLQEFTVILSDTLEG